MPDFPGVPGAFALIRVLGRLVGVRRPAPAAQGGRFHVSPRAARKSLEIIVARHPRVTASTVRLRRGPGGYEVRCTAHMTSVAGWRHVAAELRTSLRDALADELHVNGEVYVTIRYSTSPQPVSGWLDDWTKRSAPRVAAGAPAAESERAASTPGPESREQGATAG